MKNWSWFLPLILLCLLGLGMVPGIAESRITDISADAGGCGIALNDNGTIWLWGSVSDNDDTGLRPVIMPGIDHVMAITGQMYPVVLKDDGTVWLIKNYPYFENTTRFKNWPDKEPVKVPGLSGIVAIDGSQDGSYGYTLIALKDDGTVWTMGSNSYGQRGTGEGYGDNHAQAIVVNGNGTVWTLGSNGQRITGEGDSNNWQSVGVNMVEGLTDVKAVSMGAAHALAVKNDGTVWAWGFNNMGQLGDGSANQSGRATPVQVKGLNNVTAVAAGMDFSMALKDDGTVWAWGRNDLGMLGDGVPGNVEFNSPRPVQVKGLTNVVAISAGRWFALALRDDGTVWAWGDNRDFGMLGDGTLDNKNVPVQVKGLSDIVSISAGSTVSMALDKHGVVWAWGDDSAGQLGDGQHGWGRATADRVPFTEALAGPAVEPAWTAPLRQPVGASSPKLGENTIEYMSYMNGTIYAFSKNGVMAMDGNGVPRWNISIPGRWTYEKAYMIITDPHAKSTVTGNYNGVTTSKTDENSTTGQMVKAVPVFAEEGGHVYLYSLSNASDSKYQPMSGRAYLSQANYLAGKDLTAISPDGSVEWTRHFTDDVAIQDTSHVEAHGGRIYLYHGYNETVLDSSGNVLFTIENIADPISVDENGYMYAVEAAREPTRYSTSRDGAYFDYRTPSSVIEAYAPDGKLSWRKELAEKVSYSYFLPAIWNDEIGVPLYHDGMLYVPVDDGLIAMKRDGTPAWTKKFDDVYRLYYLMPTDSNGDLYLFSLHSYPRYSDGNITIVALKPDGSDIGRVDISPSIASASEGVLYADGMPQLPGRTGHARDSLDTATVTAYDLARGDYVWSFTTPVGDTRTVTVNESNVLALFPDYQESGSPAGSLGDEHSLVQVLPAGDLTYIYFRTAAWDEPVEYDKSQYTYYSALYALDKGGRLVWQKPMDSFVTAAVANNTTVYYGTNGGGIAVSTVEVAAGLALAASILLFIKFFMIGSVARARSKLGKNDNRNKIYRFVAERPGSTLHEMSKEMGMNIGTLRYHLMILSLNHRIVAYSDDAKFVRYFTNSNTYSKEDQMIISLVRRESMGKILKLIFECGEMTNGDLCGKLGLPESAVSKYLHELLRKSVLSKVPEQGTRGSYSIREEHLGRVAKAVKLLDDRPGTLIINGPAPECEATG